MEVTTVAYSPVLGRRRLAAFGQAEHRVGPGVGGSGDYANL